MESKVESSVRYDDRRKIMTQHFKSSQEMKLNEEVVGEVVVDRKATFQEEGIKKIVNDLGLQQKKIEQEIQKTKENLKDIVEITPELKKLEKDIKIINDYNKGNKMKSQLENQEVDLKNVKKDIKDIKDAIGTRLKF